MNSLMPHGWCFRWDPSLVALHASTDIIIGLAYLSIPVALLILKPKIRSRKPYMIMFALFIVFCGVGHLMDAVSIWRQLYWLKGTWNLCTAVLSVATTVILLDPVMEFLKFKEQEERPSSLSDGYSVKPGE